MTEISTGPGLGIYLRTEREKRHITIEQVASATKISIKLLHALENDNFDDLPAKPFVRGFVTSYVRYLGLDHTEILSRYEEVLDEKTGRKFDRPANAPHIFVGTDGQSDNSKTALSIVMIGFLVVAVVAYVIIKPTLKHRKGARHKAVSNEQVYTVVPPPNPENVQEVNPHPTEAHVGMSPPTLTPAPSTEKQTTQANTSTAPKTEPKKTETKPKSENTAATQPPSQPAQPIAKKEAPATPAPAATSSSETPAQAQPATQSTANQKWPVIPPGEVKYLLVVRAVEDSWIKYQADDFSLRAYTLRKGQRIFIRARNSIRFRCFKTKGIELSYDNQEFKPLNTTTTLVIPKELSDQFKDRPFSEGT